MFDSFHQIGPGLHTHASNMVLMLEAVCQPERTYVFQHHTTNYIGMLVLWLWLNQKKVVSYNIIHVVIQ